MTTARERERLRRIHETEAHDRDDHPSHCAVCLDMRATDAIRGVLTMADLLQKEGRSLQPFIVGVDAALQLLRNR